MEKLNNCPLILWINLDRSQQRRENMEILFKKYNLDNIRISAVDGNSETFSNIDFGENKFNPKKKYQYACTMSHLKAIKYFVENIDSDNVIIMEDDVSFEFLDMWKYNIKDVIDKKPKNCDVLQLAFNWGNPNYFIEHKSNYVKWRNFYSTLSYLVTKKGAIKLINKLFPNNYNFTNTTKNFHVADVCLYKSVKTFTFKYPLFTYPDDNDSNIGSNKSMHQVAKENSKLIYFLTKKSNNVPVL